MITVKCTYADGDTITTRFNGTPADARAYFVGQTFNIGSVDDNMQKCVSIAIEGDPDGTTANPDGDTPVTFTIEPPVDAFRQH
jgi:hypothetical protein